jgi:hypothetical protein
MRLMIEPMGFEHWEAAGCPDSTDLACAAENPCPLVGTPPWCSVPPMPPNPLMSVMVPTLGGLFD